MTMGIPIFYLPLVSSKVMRARLKIISSRSRTWGGGVAAEVDRIKRDCQRETLNQRRAIPSVRV